MSVWDDLKPHEKKRAEILGKGGITLWHCDEEERRLVLAWREHVSTVPSGYSDRVARSSLRRAGRDTSSGDCDAFGGYGHALRVYEDSR